MYTNPLHYDSVDYRHVWLPRQHEALEQAVAEQAVQHVETSLCGQVDAVSHGEQRDTLVRVREYEVPSLLEFLACVDTCAECATRAVDEVGVERETLREQPTLDPLEPPARVRREQHEAAAGALYEARHPQGEGQEDADEPSRDVEDAIRYAVESAAEVALERAKSAAPLHPNCRCGTEVVDGTSGEWRERVNAAAQQHEVEFTVEVDGEDAERLAEWMRDRAAEDSH